MNLNDFHDDEEARGEVGTLQAGLICGVGSTILTDSVNLAPALIFPFSTYIHIFPVYIPRARQR